MCQKCKKKTKLLITTKNLNQLARVATQSYSNLQHLVIYNNLVAF